MESKFKYVCIDPKIRDLEPWYLNDTLPLKDKKVFENHLKICPKCSQDFRIDKLVFETMGNYLGVPADEADERLAATGEGKKKKEPVLIDHEDIIINFQKADTKIKLKGYLSLYNNGKLYINFTAIDSTTSKYDEADMRIINRPYQISSSPIKIRELKEKIGQYIHLGKIDKKLNLKPIKKDTHITLLKKE